MPEKTWWTLSSILLVAAFVMMLIEWIAGLKPAIGTLFLIAGLWCGWSAESAGRQTERK